MIETILFGVGIAFLLAGVAMVFVGIGDDNGNTNCTKACMLLLSAIVIFVALIAHHLVSPL